MKNCNGFEMVPDSVLKGFGINPPDYTAQKPDPSIKEYGVEFTDPSWDIDLNFAMQSFKELGSKSLLDFANKIAAQSFKFKVWEFIQHKPDPRNFPKHFDEMASGWQRWEKNKWVSVDVPSDDILVFDVETFGAYYQFPMIGVAYGLSGWYIWLSPFVFSPYQFGEELIPLGQNKLIIGHNVQFDRARTLEAYTDNETNVYLDTQSITMAHNGLGKKLMNMCNGLDKKPYWWYKASEPSLLKAYYYHVKQWDSKAEFPTLTEDDKETRKIFIDAKPTPEQWSILHYGSIEKAYTETKRVKGVEKVTTKYTQFSFEKALSYAVNDVHCTFYLFSKLWPKFRKTSPNAATVLGDIILGKAKLPISKDWDRWIENCDKQILETQEKLDKEIDKLVYSAMGCVNPEVDPWYRHLDWSQYKSGKNKGKYKWTSSEITMRGRVLPYLLKLLWKGQPIYHIKEMGWVYTDESTGKPSRLPHKNGEGQNVGNPLSDMLSKYILGKGSDIVMTSALPDVDLKQFYETYYSTTYWTNARDRIAKQFVHNGYLIPQSLVHGTSSNRVVESLWLTVPDTKKGKIGTEVKSMVRVDPNGNFVLIGADFDGQELNIAALYADSQNGGIIGNTPFSYVHYTGDKDQKTDTHSRLATLFGITRDTAKAMNFAALYQCGVTRFFNLLKVEKPQASDEELTQIAEDILKAKRGDREWINNIPNYWGGTDSHMYNYLTRLTYAEEPRTPLLSTAMSIPIRNSISGSTLATTRNNWGIQCCGSDALRLFLVFLDWFCKLKGVQYSFVLSRHDEMWFKVSKDDVQNFANLMQAAHCLVWLTLAQNLGINTIPVRIAKFSAINVDYCLRKEVNKDISNVSSVGSVPGGYYVH